MSASPISPAAPALPLTRLLQARGPVQMYRQLELPFQAARQLPPRAAVTTPRPVISARPASAAAATASVATPA